MKIYARQKTYRTLLLLAIVTYPYPLTQANSPYRFQPTKLAYIATSLVAWFTLVSHGESNPIHTGTIQCVTTAHSPFTSHHTPVCSLQGDDPHPFLITTSQQDEDRDIYKDNALLQRVEEISPHTETLPKHKAELIEIKVNHVSEDCNIFTDHFLSGISPLGFNPFLGSTTASKQQTFAARIRLLNEGTKPSTFQVNLTYSDKAYSNQQLVIYSQRVTIHPQTAHNLLATNLKVAEPNSGPAYIHAMWDTTEACASTDVPNPHITYIGKVFPFDAEVAPKIKADAKSTDEQEITDRNTVRHYDYPYGYYRPHCHTVWHRDHAHTYCYYPHPKPGPIKDPDQPCPHPTVTYSPAPSPSWGVSPSPHPSVSFNPDISPCPDASPCPTFTGTPSPSPSEPPKVIIIGGKGSGRLTIILTSTLIPITLIGVGLCTYKLCTRNKDADDEDKSKNTGDCERGQDCHIEGGVCHNSQIHRVAPTTTQWSPDLETGLRTAHIHPEVATTTPSSPEGEQNPRHPHNSASSTSYGQETFTPSTQPRASRWTLPRYTTTASSNASTEIEARWPDPIDIDDISITHNESSSPTRSDSSKNTTSKSSTSQQASHSTLGNSL
ncbi:MAG: hypothetical protein OXT67_03895 [Zetaproteobacteria bacterium]|nr:hypothetical protein [Zetaproteobacteria bacterium]